MKVPKSSLSPLHGSDKDHSISEPSVLTALACPEIEGAWALVPSLFGELLASCKKKSPSVSCASFVPLGTKWACSRCEKWCCVLITSKSFAGAPFAVMLFCWFVGCCCFGLGEDQLSICVGALFLHLFSHL